ncbi:hypothetical protein DSCA_41660 [Desulfosarcina alkanivorans]|uniref:Sec-independent protein translocase protein TatA n=1 Tax=Desulfosarcina alkanivorans TaxID=571177 RepID=A0A5K7YM07_9BACT|nr:twin-arginine translocase TatA/TatE family subunit [Desulfosarcina alkanivorans]BBO70236.1 hypothetical protein DSCA_41660 [Desulfosarcina alkanivorans]
MFGIGMPEMILILAVALIVIGPKKLPDLAKSLGKAMGEFKKATSDLKESMQIDTELKEVKTAFNDINRDDKREAPTDAAQPDQEPVAATGQVETDDTGKSEDGDDMDKLKAAFDRQHMDVPDVDGSTSADGDATTEKAEPNDETRKE